MGLIHQLISDNKLQSKLDLLIFQGSSTSGTVFIAFEMFE